MPALFEPVGAVDGSAVGVEVTFVVEVLVDRVQSGGGAVTDAVQCCARQTLGLEFGPTQGVQFLVLVARVVAQVVRDPQDPGRVLHVVAVFVAHQRQPDALPVLFGDVLVQFPDAWQNHGDAGVVTLVVGEGVTLLVLEVVR